MILCLLCLAWVSPVQALPQASSKPQELGWHSKVCSDPISAMTIGIQSRPDALCSELLFGGTKPLFNAFKERGIDY